MSAGETILVVDDDQQLRAVLCEFLQRDGHDVATAATGQQALALLTAVSPEVVLLDLRLPDMDGLALMQAARGTTGAPDVVVVTGNASTDSAIAAVDAGAAGYLAKPVKLKDLRRLVGQILERRRLQRENRQLSADVAEQLRETETLLAVSSALTSTIDLQEALRRVCRELTRLTGADFGVVYVHDTAEDLLVPYAGYHVPKEHSAALALTRLPLREQGFHLPLWSGRRPVFSDDVAADERFGHELFRRIPHQSGLLLPLVLDDAVVGVFYLAWKTVRPRFGARELALLERLTGQTALRLRNARLYDRAESDRRRLEVLYDISGRLAAVADADEILCLIVNEATRLLEADAAGIRLRDGDDLVVRARTETAAAIMSRPRIGLGESLSGRVVAEGRPIAVDDLITDTRFDPAHKGGAITQGMHGFLGVPLRAHGQVIGTLNVFTKSRRRFTGDEISLLSTFADQAALAIDKTRLFAELRQILESTSDGIIFTDLAGRIQSVNRRVWELFDRPPSVRNDLSLTTLLAERFDSPEARRQALAPFQRLLADPAGGGDGDLELPGLARVFHWTARPTRDGAGAVVGVTLTLQDVTHEREMSRLKSDFVSFVTHQLRTPLSGIKWLLELTAQSQTDPALVAEYLQDARASADRLIGLVNDLLNVSRFESGKLTTVPAPVDLGAVTRDLVDELTPLIELKRHRLTLDSSPVPRVLADAQMLRQVVLNLVSNAIKYTPAGGDIVIRMAYQDGSVVWSVRDSGVGVPREAQRWLFQKFYRAENVRTIETEGTGLGLYMVRLILERLGGRVWCESEEGKGSTFTFTLPRAGER